MLIRVGKLQFICLIGGVPSPGGDASPPGELAFVAHFSSINCSLPTRINIDLKKFVTF